MKKTYYYQHPSGKNKIVNAGFCWSACLFGPWWALINRIWDALFYLVAFTIVLNFYMSYAEARKSLWLLWLGIFISFAIMYICGKIGNAWHITHLEQKGYVRVSENSMADNVDGYSHSVQVPTYDWTCLSCSKENSAGVGACVSCEFPAYPSGKDFQLAKIKTVASLD